MSNLGVLSKVKILKNMDENDEFVENERKIPLKQNSMHKVVPCFLVVIGVSIFVACFIP
jgi:hypothetical protein